MLERGSDVICPVSFVTQQVFLMTGHTGTLLSQSIALQQRGSIRKPPCFPASTAVLGRSLEQGISSERNVVLPLARAIISRAELTMVVAMLL